MFPAALAALLSLLLFCSNPVVASPFVVTSYYEAAVTTYEDYTYHGLSTTTVEFGETYTRLVNVKPTATAVSTLSVATTVDYYYSDVTVVNVLVPTGAGEPVTRDYDSTTTTAYYAYYIELAYTASSSCSSRWVYTTSAAVDLPPIITPTPTSISTVYSQYQAFGATSTLYYAFIDPTILPASSLSSIKSYSAPYFTNACTVPSSYETGVVTSGSGSSSTSGTSSSWDGDRSLCQVADYNNYGYGYYYSDDVFQTVYVCPDGSTFTKGPSLLAVILAIIFGWLGLFLIIGFIESFFAFSRLARGRRARRGLPISFAFLFPFLSCFFLCCHKRGFQAKTPAEQETMTAEWKATGFFTKLGRWLKWGFRYKYPTFLGTAPLRRRKWQNKDLPVAPPNGAVPNGAPQMVGPQGPMPPPGSMYVVGPPPTDSQRGSVYPPPAAGWYAPQPLDANGNPVPVQYPYAYPPQAYQQPQEGAAGAVPGEIPTSVQSGVSPQGSPPQGLPAQPQQAHLGVVDENRGLPTDSPVSPASAVVGGSPVVGAREVAGAGEGSAVVHEAPAGVLRGNVEEGKGKAVEERGHGIGGGGAA